MVLYLVLLGILPYVIYDFLPRVTQANLYSRYYQWKYGCEPNLFWLQEGCPHLIIRDEKDPLRDQADVIYCNGYLYKPSVDTWWLWCAMLCFFFIGLVCQGFGEEEELIEEY